MKLTRIGLLLGSVAAAAFGTVSCGQPGPNELTTGPANAAANVDTSTVEGACVIVKDAEPRIGLATAAIEENLVSNPADVEGQYGVLSFIYRDAADTVTNPELKAQLETSMRSVDVYQEYQVAVVAGSGDTFDKTRVLTAASDLAASSDAINAACGTSIGVKEPVTAATASASASTAPSSAPSIAASSTPQAGGSTQDDCAIIDSYDPQLIAIANTTQAALEKDPAGAAAGYQATADLYAAMAGRVGNPDLKAALEKEQAAMIVYFKYQKSTAAGNLGANSYDKVTAAAKQIEKADKAIVTICGSAS